MATQKSNNSAKKSVQTEPSPTRKNELTTSTQKYAQMINFQELQRILQQNISKGTSKTYTQYRNFNHT